MSEVMRLSMSIEKPLYQQLEKLVRQGGYSNRSEFVRSMIRDKLVQQEWSADREVVGALTLVYNHHRRGLTEKLIRVQHDSPGVVLATTHVHISHDHCVEMVLLRGRARGIRHLADRLRQLKGVLHAELSMASTGAGLG